MKRISFQARERIVYIKVEVGNDIKIVPHALWIFTLLFNGRCKLLDEFDEGIERSVRFSLSGMFLMYSISF